MSTPVPAVEELVAMVLGDLDPSQAAALEARLAHAPEARRLLDQIRALVTTLSTDDGVSPPEALVRRVKSLVGAAPVGTPSLREVIASLVFDSLGKVAVAGFRGTMDARQLAYSSDAADIDLRVSSQDASRRAIRGQVTPTGDAVAIDVVVAHPGQSAPLSATPVDSRGMFSLESPPGTFDLRVRVGDTVVTLPSLSIE